MTPLALIAAALTLVIIGGGFDLSTGAIFGVATVTRRLDRGQCRPAPRARRRAARRARPRPRQRRDHRRAPRPLVPGDARHQPRLPRHRHPHHRRLPHPGAHPRVHLARPRPDRRAGQRRRDRAGRLRGADDVPPEPHHLRPPRLRGRRQRGGGGPLRRPRRAGQDRHLRADRHRLRPRRGGRDLAPVDGLSRRPAWAWSSRRSPPSSSAAPRSMAARARCGARSPASSCSSSSTTPSTSST